MASNCILVVSDVGDILDLRLTRGNIHDTQPVPNLVKRLFGKFFGDKGYLSQTLRDDLWVLGLFYPHQQLPSPQESPVQLGEAVQSRRHHQRVLL